MNCIVVSRLCWKDKMSHWKKECVDLNKDKVAKKGKKKLRLRLSGHDFKTRRKETTEDSRERRREELDWQFEDITLSILSLSWVEVRKKRKWETSKDIKSWKTAWETATHREWQVLQPAVNCSQYNDQLSIYLSAVWFTCELKEIIATKIRA